MIVAGIYLGAALLFALVAGAFGLEEELAIPASMLWPISLPLVLLMVFFYQFYRLGKWIS